MAGLNSKSVFDCSLEASSTRCHRSVRIVLFISLERLSSNMQSILSCLVFHVASHALVLAHSRITTDSTSQRRVRTSVYGEAQYSA